ncbi:uncharacterized protein [Amphiura filiformis]|uniref:uncharacterized protein isoform X1 n=1 Tax=Amphiura filiformis TaxID=82378 RepID=UPI003B22875D
MSIEELKAKITNNLQCLQQCTDYTTSDAACEAADDNNDVLLSILNQPDKQKALAKHVARLNLGTLFKRVWESLSRFITKKHSQGYAYFGIILEMYVNITDISPEVSKELGEVGCIRLMLQAMETFGIDYNGDAGPLYYITTILLNSIQDCTENITIYRRANAVSIYKRYLDSENMEVKTDSLRILAYIVDEEESSLLQTTNDAVAFLLSLLKDATSNKDHRAYLDSATESALELIQALNKLAVNDANKKEIAKHGGIPVFTRMLRSGFVFTRMQRNNVSKEEQCAAVQALWHLAFIDEIRTSKEMQTSVKALEKLAKSDNHHLQEICAHALAQIKGHLSSKKVASSQSKEVPPSYEEAISQPAKSASSRKVQVMISYQWDNQKTTIRLRDNLVNAGYQVWMDITHMRGSLLDAMAKAVETSSLVLICMSEKYKNSNNCRAEAQYAFTKEKPIVPLLLERGYKPDGWLGIIGLTTLYHDITSPKKLDTKMPEILAAIQYALGGDVDEIDGPILPILQEVQGTARKSKEKGSSQAKKLVRQWSIEDVQDWLKENKELIKLCEAFKTFTGRHLEKWYGKYCEDKNAFYNHLEATYECSMDDRTRFEFEVAFEKLFEEE